MQIGANRSTIVAKLAGGAQMFAFGNTLEVMRIGERNIDASRQILSMIRIPVLSEDVGLNYGRTIELYSADGSVLVKTIGRGSKTL